MLDQMKYLFSSKNDEDIDDKVIRDLIDYIDFGYVNVMILNERLRH